MEKFEGLLEVDNALWQGEVGGIREFYAKFGDRLPAELVRQLEKMEANLKG